MSGTVNFQDNQNCDAVLLRKLEKRDAKRNDQKQRGGDAAGDRSHGMIKARVRE
jgi:hypothetical protein